LQNSQNVNKLLQILNSGAGAVFYEIHIPGVERGMLFPEPG